MDLDAIDLIDRRPPPPGPITYEEFLEWADDETHAEWVDGQAILMPMPVAEPHAAILSFLFALFKIASGMGRHASVYGEPFQMWLRAQRRGRAPDLMVVLPENRHRMDRLFLDGPADLIVEIVSPESRRRDRVEKLAEYEQARVREYWLVDSERPAAEFRVLGEDGRYRLSFSGNSGAYQSPVFPQLRLRVEWLWQRPEPELAELLRELGIVL